MTKSYNYTPTHFLYSSLLFFLLIFMHQQIHCHTLPKPFFQIFLFRIYAPTVQIYPHHIDFELNETSAPVYTHLRANPATANQSTNDTVPQPHSTDSAPIQPHKNTHPHSLHNHTHPRDAGPPDVDDVDADAPTLMQHRCNRRPDADAAPCQSAIGTGQVPDRIRPRTRN